MIPPPPDTVAATVGAMALLVMLPVPAVVAGAGCGGGTEVAAWDEKSPSAEVAVALAVVHDTVTLTEFCKSRIRKLDYLYQTMEHHSPQQ